MVLVQGSGTIGLGPQRYGTVSTRPGEAAPETRCSTALSAISDPVACWIQTDLIDPVVAPRAVTVGPVCVDMHPFPGAAAPYTLDGMTTWDATQLQRLLATRALGGRRLCTMTEFQAAVAGLRSNRPIVYGDQHNPERCPAGVPIGTDPACRNPETGVHEYGAVHSHWVVADPDFVAHACPTPPCRGAGRRLLQPGALIVAGGTGRLQTRQAPLTPHTWHDHGTPTPDGCDDMGHDDQPILCADPNPSWADPPAALLAEDAAWQDLLVISRDTGRMTPMLSAGLGEDVCPPDRAGPEAPTARDRPPELVPSNPAPLPPQATGRPPAQ